MDGSSHTKFSYADWYDSREGKKARSQRSASRCFPALLWKPNLMLVNAKMAADALYLIYFYPAQGIVQTKAVEASPQQF